MNTECPKCGSEGAYFNGVCYECPDCGFEWGDIRLSPGNDSDV